MIRSSMKRRPRRLLLSASTQVALLSSIACVNMNNLSATAFAPGFHLNSRCHQQNISGALLYHSFSLQMPTSPSVAMRTDHQYGLTRCATSYSSNASSARNASSSPTTMFSHAMEQTEIEREMKKDALSITQAAIDAVDPYNAIQAHLSCSKKSKDTNGGGSSLIHLINQTKGETVTYDVSNYDAIYIAAFGKAASSMGLAAAEILSQTDLPIKGVVITKDDHATKEQINALSSHNIELHYAGHPIPDQRSIKHSRSLLSQLRSLNENTETRTLVINCVSGGGSSLFCTPKEPLNLTHMSQFNQRLLASGMPITEMNILRKKVEEGKGGGLLRAAFPSTCITMVLSDVIGDPLDLIASGPSIEDESTWSEALGLVERYGLGHGGKYEVTSEILDVLNSGREKEEGENTGKNQGFEEVCCEDDQLSGESVTVLVGNNALSVSAAAREAEKRGYNPVILGTTIEGEAADIARMYVDMAQQLQYQKTNASLSMFPITTLPAALIAGGETTVTLTKNSGKGGRNQEIGLAAALKMRSCNLRDIVLASVGTDGTDGPTDAAGAVVDGGTIDRVESNNGHMYTGEEALRNHDAYTFFDESEKDHALVKIGATGTNVADVCVTLVR